jgi:hypothetical protein
MANTLLTSDKITREALRILHQKLNFVGNVNRQYDDSFAQSGAKIGDTLRIRLPNQFAVRTGATMGAVNAAATDTVNQVVPLVVNNQKGVDMYFSSKELTMSLDDFSSQYIDPAVSVLAANIEADVLNNVFKEVAQQVGTAGTPVTALSTILSAGARLDNSLAPRDSNRSLVVSPITQAAIIDGTKTYFQDSSELGKQYKEGQMGRMGGFDWYSNTLLPSLTTGTSAASALATTAVPAEGLGTGLVCTVTSGQTIAIGSVITFSNVYEVHPETKATTSRLKQFVVTASNTVTTSCTMTISPAMYTSASGARQNVNALAIAATSTVTSASGAVSTAFAQNLAFHKDAFCFATADLILPKGRDFASRQVMDGISMRIIRDYDIANDRMPCRLDVLYGYKTIRPELAVRITE